MFTHILSTIRSSWGLAQSIIPCLAQVFLPVAQGSYMETTVNGGHLYPLVPWIQTVLHWLVLKWQNNTPDRSRLRYNKAVAKHSSTSFLQQSFVSLGFSAVLNSDSRTFWSEVQSSMLQEDKAWQGPLNELLFHCSLSTLQIFTPKAHCNSMCQYSHNSPKQPYRNQTIKAIKAMSHTN